MAGLLSLIDLYSLEEIMTFFHEAAGLSIGILDDQHQWLVTVGWQHICTDFHRKNPQARLNCLTAADRIQNCLDGSDYFSYACPNGLNEVAMPLRLDQETLGYFFLGQYLHEAPDLDFFRRQAISKGYDVDKYLQAVSQVPVVSRQRVDYLMRFFSHFFQLVTRIGSENKRSRQAEQEIQKAKAQLEHKVMERTRELNQALMEVGDLAAQLNDSLQQVEHLAFTDTLTQTFNRRKFDEVIRDESLKADQKDTPFSLIMLDIDHFKEVNDVYGHSCGDRVLRELCALLRTLIRQGDLLIRWGGEEFLILLPTTLIKEATLLAERIRGEVEKNPFNEIGRLTVSLGVAQMHPEDNIDRLLKRVDDALYRAKGDGRNQVVVAEDGAS